MKFSTTLVFLILFAVVGGVYLFLNFKLLSESPKLPAVSGQAANTLLNLSAGDFVNWIQIQNLGKKETVTLARQNHIWMLKYPVVYPVNPVILDNLVRAVESGLGTQPFESGKNWEEYGLNHPALKIGIQTEKGDLRRYLYLGASSPLGDSVYARWDKESEIFLVDGELKRVFSQSVYHLREKRVFRISPVEISKVALQSGSEIFELEKNGDLWKWSAPLPVKGMSVEEALMGEFLSAIADLFVKDFLDHQSVDGRETGLQGTRNWIKVWPGKNKPEVIYLGNEIPTRHAFYARREGESIPLLIDRDKILSLFGMAKEMSDNLVQLS